MKEIYEGRPPGITENGRFGPLQHEPSVDDYLPSEVSGGVCLRFGRGGLHSLLTAIVIKKKSVNTLYHHILFLTFINTVSKLQIIYPTSNETKPNK